MKSYTRKVAALFGVGVFLACVTACKKKVGDACTGDQALCLDQETFLSCRSGKLTQMACRGPNGCSATVSGVKRTEKRSTSIALVSCDFSANEAGTPCTTDDDTATCSPDKRAMLSCKAGKIQRTACRGPKSCTQTKEEVSCDTSAQELGDVCEGSAAACSLDKKDRLQCMSGKFELALRCRGPKGCSLGADRRIECDRGGQAPGEPCGDDGGFACSSDNKAVVKCIDRKWVNDETCRGKTKCAVQDRRVGCS